MRPWPALIPGIAKGRGSWLRVFAADINGDGQLDLTAANKGAPDIVRPEAGDPDNGATSLITFSGPPLESSAWKEQVLFQEGIPNNAMPLDIDGDGDLDVLAAKRVRNQLVLIENLGVGEGGALRTLAHPLLLAPAFEAPEGWLGLANAFQAEAADLNGDGRLDLVVNVIERTRAQTALSAGLAWLEQPESLEFLFAGQLVFKMNPSNTRFDISTGNLKSVQRAAKASFRIRNNRRQPIGGRLIAIIFHGFNLVRAKQGAVNPLG